MKTRKEWQKPKGYNYPYFTTKLVAEILGLNPVALSQKRFKYATELAEGVYLWSEENVLNMIKTQRDPGNKDVYKLSPKWQKKSN